MTNYRTFKSTKLTSGQSGSFNLSGSSNAWGVMRSSSGAGTITLEGGGTIDVADIAAGVPFPCYPTGVTATGGSVYVLS
jgi:hypothetical protein